MTRSTRVAVSVGAALLLAFSAGCVPDPKVDPCRDPNAAGCAPHDASPPVEDDAGSAPDVDAGGALDSGRDAGRDSGLDAQVDAGKDSGVPTPLDAGTRRDSAVPRDSAPPVGWSSLRDAAFRDGSTAPAVLPLEGDLGVHDPAIIEANGSFVIFSTGRGIPVKRSSNLLRWTDSGRVFASNPAWIAGEVAGATDLWAPDIAYYNGKYHLYYSASTFGSRNSCIGHATATDLALLNFVDQGPVVCTEQTDDYNAIDPAFVLDENGAAWLTFGSFWSGIKLIRLNADGGREGTEMYSLASRDSVEAVEAPYIVRRDGYYYLFVSFDLCCRGTGSTYRIMVGRSESLTGPYFDADGKPMLGSGGGSTVVLGDQRYRGPGHNAALTIGQEQFLVYHAYDAELGGAPKLRIADLSWSSTGWPLQVGP